VGNYYASITRISKPEAGVSERRPERFPQPPQGTGTLRFPPPRLHQQPTAKNAATTSRVEKEWVENAFCSRVGSKTRGKDLFKTSGDVLSPLSPSPST